MSEFHQILPKLVMTAALGCSMIAGSASATEAWLSSRIKAVYPLSDGTFILVPVDDHPSCTNANTPNYHYVTVGENGVSTDGINRLYAAALAAAAQRLVLWIVFDDATTYCYINRLFVTYE